MDHDSIRDLFQTFGPVSVRRMFGGAGIYAGETMFALVADGVIYLKAGERNQQDFEAEGLAPFTYTAANGKRAVQAAGDAAKSRPAPGRRPKKSGRR